MLRLGYHTNGFAHHRLEDAFAILREIGYQSVAVTVERELLDPPDRSGTHRAVNILRAIQARNPLSITIETGSRYILDPRRKHQPTLISSDEGQRRRRIGFIKACIDVAAGVGAESVSLWSGAGDGPSEEHDAFVARLVAGLREVLEHARRGGVRLSFEPEPGMLIDTMAGFQRLHDALEDSSFGLTLDVGHVHCLNDGNAEQHIGRWRPKLWNVHMEDMRRGVHEHLLPGEGEIDFQPIFEALHTADYTGPVHVELSRHSHNAVEAAQQAFTFLTPFLQRGANA